jgi:hypothetical protein
MKKSMKKTMLVILLLFFPNFRPATEDTIIISSSSVADFAFDIGSRYQPT